jgi:hypothetical protein
MSVLFNPTAKSLVLGGFFGATAYGVAWSVSSASVQAVSLVIGAYLTPLLGAMLAANLGVLLPALLVVGLGSLLGAAIYGFFGEPDESEPPSSQGQKVS